MSDPGRTPERPERRPERPRAPDLIPETHPTPRAEAAAAPLPPVGETRGRPADLPFAAEELSRRPLGYGDENPFHIPEHLKRPGWSYEWKTRSVLNMPVRGSDVALEQRQGWRPAPVADFYDILPPGYQGNAVEQDGMILMMRPARLDAEAKQELWQKAEQQKRDRLKSALAGDPGDRETGERFEDRRMPRTRATITLEGEVGVHEQKHDRRGVAA